MFWDCAWSSFIPFDLINQQVGMKPSKAILSPNNPLCKVGFARTRCLTLPDVDNKKGRTLVHPFIRASIYISEFQIVCSDILRMGFTSATLYPSIRSDCEYRRNIDRSIQTFRKIGIDRSCWFYRKFVRYRNPIRETIHQFLSVFLWFKMYFHGK